MGKKAKDIRSLLTELFFTYRNSVSEMLCDHSRVAVRPERITKVSPALAGCAKSCWYLPKPGLRCRFSDVKRNRVAGAAQGEGRARTGTEMS